MDRIEELARNYSREELQAGLQRQHEIWRAETFPGLNRDNYVPLAVPDLRIEELDMSQRSFNCLRRVGIHSLSDFQQVSEKEFRSILGLGKQSLLEVKAKIAEHGGGLYPWDRTDECLKLKSWLEEVFNSAEIVEVAARMNGRWFYFQIYRLAIRLLDSRDTPDPASLLKERGFLP